MYHGVAYVMFVLSLRLFKEGNRIRVFFRNMHDTAVKRYARYTCRDVVDKYHNRLQTDEPLAPDCPIWIFWWQGEDNMPPLVRSCLKSVKRYAENHPVKVVSQYNISKYLNIPQHITERLKENAGGIMRGMSFIHFSDYVRMALLYEHGGIWLDATCFLSAPLSIPQNALFVSTRTKILEKVPNKGKWNIYYLGAAKHNVLFGYMRDMLSGYWKKNDFVIDYFFTDYCISLAYESFPYIRKMIDELPALSSDYDPHSIYFLLNRPYDQNRALAICSEVNLHKLTWKGVLNEYTDNNELTFYGWILRN